MDSSGSNSAVECKLPKLDVAGSIPVSRSPKGPIAVDVVGPFFHCTPRPFVVRLPGYPSCNLSSIESVMLMRSLRSRAARRNSCDPFNDSTEALAGCDLSLQKVKSQLSTYPEVPIGECVFDALGDPCFSGEVGGRMARMLICVS
jgi:hypothetical protein